MDIVSKSEDLYAGVRDEEDDVEEETWPEEEWEEFAKRCAKAQTDKICPYLDTIDRKLLDFDFEKLCSISLSNLNVYACLVCGKYYQGRGKNSHAYFHSLEADHHVFINLSTEQIYCLPDNYEVYDASLEDIKYNLHPTYTARDVRRLHANKQYIHALDGTDYLPGCVGLNNIKFNDWLNVIVHALSRVTPLREFFLIEKNYAKGTILVRRFGELLCKLWNPKSFKGHVSPHELLQAVSAASEKKYRIGIRADPLEFLQWFLQTLHRDLGGTKKADSSIISKCFQGEIRILTMKPKPITAGPIINKKAGDGKSKDEPEPKEKEYVTVVQRKKFFFISLALPPAPLFKDEADRSLIPQVPLFDLLTKFDGITTETLADGTKNRYSINRLPKYLMFHFKRFKDNNWFMEKNPTLVNFPIKNLDMKQYKTLPEPPTMEELIRQPVSKLRKLMEKKKLPTEGITERKEMAQLLAQYFAELKVPTKYDLIANVCHDGKPDKGEYRAHIFHSPSQTWFELQDLHVWTTETMPQLVALSETYIQVYELQPAK